MIFYDKKVRFCHQTALTVQQSAGVYNNGTNQNAWPQHRTVAMATVIIIHVVLLLLLYTLFIVEIKTGKMPNNIGPTVNTIL